MMRPERLTFFLIFIASLVLLAGMGIVATSQAQESFVSPNTDLLKSQPAAWLFFPGLMIMSAGIVSTVVAPEVPVSRNRVVPHLTLFGLSIGGLFIFLPVVLGIGGLFVAPQTNEVRSWVYFGYLGPLGDIPTRPSAHYFIIPYLLEFAVIFGSLLLVWSLFKPEEFHAFFKKTRRPAAVGKQT